MKLCHIKCDHPLHIIIYMLKMSSVGQNARWVVWLAYMWPWMTLNSHLNLFRAQHLMCQHFWLSATSPTYCCYLRNPSLMDYYSFNRPRRDGWPSWPCWLIGSGHLTHKVVTWPVVGPAQDRESSPARTSGLTTMLRHQLWLSDKTVLKSAELRIYTI